MTFSHVLPASAHTVWRHIPGKGSDWVDNRQRPGPQEEVADDQTVHSIEEIRRYLNPPLKDDQAHPSTVPDRVLEKWGRLFDIILPSARRSCCFTRGAQSLQHAGYLTVLISTPAHTGYSKMAERSGSVLQMNEELDVCQRLATRVHTALTLRGMHVDNAGL